MKKDVKKNVKKQGFIDSFIDNNQELSVWMLLGLMNNRF